MIYFLCLLATVSHWYDQKLQGWYYFQDEAEEAISTPEEAGAVIDSEKDRLKELLSLAILDPTKENVSAYAREQKKWSDQSSLFAQTYSEVSSLEDAP
jgi:conjugal transfer pilus assembly protein TraF